MRRLRDLQDLRSAISDLCFRSATPAPVYDKGGGFNRSAHSAGCLSTSPGPRSFQDFSNELSKVFWCGMGRDQATSRGSLGVYSAISHRPIRTKQRPNQQQNAAPLRHRRVVDTGPEAVENRISTTPRARAARHRKVPVLCLERHRLRMQHPSM